MFRIMTWFREKDKDKCIGEEETFSSCKSRGERDFGACLFMH